ncbi:hypothetical protein DDI_3032 [Dickeya dianthicola RNS04.9]|nr:hypothetical protein DDI_3032 [Dickeya dianthicola RNS04.9]
MRARFCRRMPPSETHRRHPIRMTRWYTADHLPAGISAAAQVL